jgi:quaternary ammonium compound-resistance protein SugE
MNRQPHSQAVAPKQALNSSQIFSNLSTDAITNDRQPRRSASCPLFETGFAVLLKQSFNFTQLWPTVGFALCALISFGLLNLALGRLEVGPACAVWTGTGATGTAAVGILALGESDSALKLVSIGLILAGAVGLNLSGVTP